MWDGIRRFGKPRTKAERKKRHEALYGTDKVPVRGAGLLKRIENLKKKKKKS